MCRGSLETVLNGNKLGTWKEVMVGYDPLPSQNPQLLTFLESPKSQTESSLFFFRRRVSFLLRTCEWTGQESPMLKTREGAGPFETRRGTSGRSRFD